jgi:uncharacterized protein YbbC (DUF1343 family)
MLGGVSGVKLTCFNISKGHRVALHVNSAEYKRRHELPFLVLSGSTDYLLPALVARQHGCIGGPCVDAWQCLLNKLADLNSANLYPKCCMRLFQLTTEAFETGSIDK